MAGVEIENVSRDPDHAPLNGNLSSVRLAYPCTKFNDSRFSRYEDMIAGVKIEYVACDPDHANFGVVCHPKARTRYSLSVCKI